MEKKAVSTVTLGKGSDYYFEFCRLDDEGHLEFGIEQNLNEYVILNSKDKNYFTKLQFKLNNIKKEDYNFYCSIGDLLNDARKKSSK